MTPSRGAETHIRPDGVHVVELAMSCEIGVQFTQGKLDPPLYFTRPTHRRAGAWYARDLFVPKVQINEAVGWS
jgi:hypothetical protein